MKQATVKSLGVAALGVALSAAVAGTASAAVTDDVEQTAGGVVSTLPDLGQGNVLPDEDEQELPLASDTLAASQPAASSPLDSLTEPVTSLLGGLPVDPTTALNSTGALGSTSPLGSLPTGALLGGGGLPTGLIG